MRQKILLALAVAALIAAAAYTDMTGLTRMAWEWTFLIILPVGLLAFAFVRTMVLKK